MGFFDIEQKQQQGGAAMRGHSVAFLHKHQCEVCPRNHQKGLSNPQMKPRGNKKPFVYMLGESPSSAADKINQPFAGEAAKVLKTRIPRDWADDIRWNNIVRTATPDDRRPAQVEIECCRPSVLADIERTKPEAIFGFGPAVFHWLTGENVSGVGHWVGRRLPVRVGGHVCWFFPMYDPADVLASRRHGKYVSDMELGFSIHLKQAFQQVDEGLPVPELWTSADAMADIELITGDKKSDLKRAIDFLEGLYSEKLCGFDWETNKLRPYFEDSKIISVAIATRSRCVSIALRHKQAKWSKAELAELEKAIYDFMREAKTKKVSHHLQFEAEWAGVKFGREMLRHDAWECSESQAYVLDERPGALSLDFLCLQYFGLRIKELSNLNTKELDNVAIDSVLRYNGIDAKAHLKLFLAQRKELKRVGLSRVYRHARSRALAMVAIQMRGIPRDVETIERFKRRYENRIKRVEAEIKALPEIQEFKRRYGYDFSPSKDKDIRRALGEIARVRIEGNLDAESLKKIKHPLAKLIRRYRPPSKMLSTYVTPLLDGSPVVFSDEMLHPIINTTKTRTWRTSSEEPNAQNFPKRGKKKIVRKQIKPAQGWVTVAFDYAGIQARNVAMESNDKRLVKHYWEHYDIHSDWMERIARVIPNWATKQELADKDTRKEIRNTAKNGFVFPCFFGVQAKSLVTAKHLGSRCEVTEKQARRIHDEFFGEFSGIAAWHDRIERDYKELGYVTGLSEFRRHAPISYNQLINSPIQADETIIVCEAGIALSKYDDELLHPNLMIHDDYTFFWPKEKVDEYAPIVLGELLEIRFDWINVPMGVEMSIGPNWAELEAVGEYESAPGKSGWWEVKK